MNKAYIVKYKGQDWCDLTHAETAKDAIKQFWKHWCGIGGEYIDVRATRIPVLDSMPLTGNNIVDIAEWNDEDWRNSKTDTCQCGLCRGA